QLVGGDVEVHQPAALVLGVDEARGELLDVRLGRRQPPLELRGAGGAAGVAAARRQLAQVQLGDARQLAGAVQGAAQLGDQLEAGGSRRRRAVAQAADLAGRREITARISSLWNGFLM